MKALIKNWTLILLTSIFIFSCTEESDLPLAQDNPNEEIAITGMGDGIRLKHGNAFEDYDIEISEELISSDECEDVYVSGVVSFYFEGELIFSIDFGNGACDGMAEFTYLDMTGNYVTEIIYLDEFILDGEEDYVECFEIVFPISFTMPDGSVLEINNEDDFELLWEWYEDHSDEDDEEPELNFPFQVEYPDGTVETIYNEEQLEELEDICDQDYDDEDGCEHEDCEHEDDDCDHGDDCNHDDDDDDDGDDDDGDDDGDDDDGDDDEDDDCDHNDGDCDHDD